MSCETGTFAWQVQFAAVMVALDPLCPAHLLHQVAAMIQLVDFDLPGILIRHGGVSLKNCLLPEA